MNQRKRVAVISRLRGDYEANMKRAEALCLDAVNAGVAPFAPHLLYTRFLDDRVEAQREAGIECGLAFLEVCDEVWVDDSRGVSTGMAAEIKAAHARGIPVVYPSRWAGI